MEGMFAELHRIYAGLLQGKTDLHRPEADLKNSPARLKNR
jgi:hypothetical protein